MTKKGRIFAILLMFVVGAASTIGVPTTAYATGENEEKQEDGAKQEDASSQKLTDKNDLYFEALKNANKPNNNVATVDYGTVTRQERREVNLLLPKYKKIKVPASYGPVVLDKILVKKGDTVKKGTPVAKIITSVDKVTLERMNLELERTQKAYNQFVTDQKKNLREQKNALNKIVDKQDKLIADLEYEKAELEFEIGIKDQKKQIESIKEEIEKSKKIKDTKELLVPTDGYIISISAPGEGKEIDDQTALMKIVDPTCVLFQVEDVEQLFKYNMNVNITINSEGADEQTITGKIVTITSELYDGRQSAAGYSYIQADEPVNLMDLLDKKISATIDVCVMDNVLTAPIETLIPDEYSDGVTRVASAYALVDGNLIEKYFVFGACSDKNYQFVTGMEKGEKLIINTREIER